MQRVACSPPGNKLSIWFDAKVDANIKVDFPSGASGEARVTVSTADRTPPAVFSVRSDDEQAPATSSVTKQGWEIVRALAVRCRDERRQLGADGA